MITQNPMGPVDLIRHPLIFTGITLPDFVRWYFWEQPRKILLTYLAYLRAFLEIFSFLFLLRTLFAPWRQISDVYTSNGFNIGRFMETLTLNMVSRVIGFLFRSITIAIGIVFLLALSILFMAFLGIWVVFPVAFWIALSYVVSAAL